MRFMSQTNFAVLVHACDRYRLLYQGFEYFFNKHWDFSTECKYYFATEEADVNVKGFENIKSGKGEWSDRLIVLLQEKVKEKYIIYLQEDVWFTENISAEFFNALFRFIEENQYKQVKLHSADIYKTIGTPDFIEGFNIARVDNAASRYLMSHQVTIWDKEFLLSNLKPNENPWRNENRGTKRMKKSNPEIYHVDYFAQDHSPAINSNMPEVVRSNFHTVSLNGMLNGHFLVFADKLPRDTEENTAYAEKLVHHYQNQLTHDGRERPRKDDIFKRTKKWFLKTFGG